MPQKKDLKRLNSLKEKGFLTEDEYKKALSQMDGVGASSSLKHTANEPLVQGADLRKQKGPLPKDARQAILFIIALLGAFCVLSGVGLIIASNWALIPASVKMTAGIVALVLSSFGVLFCRAKSHNSLAEVMLFASFFLVGGNIALIQQIFNLSISFEAGSRVWWGISLPFVILTKKNYLRICSIILFIFGFWDYFDELLYYLNYQILAGILFVIVFLSFLGDEKIRRLRAPTLGVAMALLFLGDLHTDDMVGFVFDFFFVIALAALPQDPKLRAVRFCHFLFVFIVLRVVDLFASAYHNLMSTGVQLIVFGALLLALAGGYCYFFDRIEQTFERLTKNDEK